MADVDVESIRTYRRLIDGLLARAEQAKPDKQIEPPLTESHLGETIWVLEGEDAQVVGRFGQQTQFAAVEIAFREKFYSLLASTSIDEPGFIQIWNLLDIISIFSDNEQCEPGLIFWLIEELLDSQTIDGCRKVFDYLESRRERNTKKHFKQKNLIILRSCNELLRRLSRAEDTVFCGRVFIFLFQSFPLGDKSAVNLRGEYHTENVTTFDEITNGVTKESSDADVEMADEQSAPPPSESQKDEGEARPSSVAASQTPEPSKPPRVTISTSEDREENKKVDLDTLYPMFWGLQAYFSAPTKVFDPQHFATFKFGLEATLDAFRKVNTDLENSSSNRASEELRKANKRKRNADGQEIGGSFNPKYLTSRDLFDLEVNDTAFRRHVLVQALILLDFMLSLTPKAKSKLADLTNKSVLYGFVLNDEDAKWAVKVRKAIEEYLQQGVGGKFYYRMVDTVLSRDKNWVRWKAEGCPLIERPPVSVTEYLGARDVATKAYANKRLRASPMGSLDLKFLSDGESLSGLERLKEAERFNVPSADSFMMGIMDDELDIDMAQTDEDKGAAVRSKESKTWRILRLSAKSKLAAFDKIEDGKNLKILFEAPQPAEGTPQPREGTPQTAETTKPSTAEESAGPEESKENDGAENGELKQDNADSIDAAVTDGQAT
ncbi:THO complex subunit 1 transcription elongation factor-domain-containing protein [Aspergillus ambiguus]|uniref:THO complex subunit THO1/HPR1 n=1 Tax=Aspergillus ambiguus TaxID=176160 RepID=UPI003CCD7B26